MIGIVVITVVMRRVCRWASRVSIFMRVGSIIVVLPVSSVTVISGVMVSMCAVLSVLFVCDGVSSYVTVTLVLI